MEKSKQKKLEISSNIPLEEYLKNIPEPPPEHTHELDMEKNLKQLLKKKKGM